MNADGEVGLGHAQVGLRAQAHKAEEIGGVAAIGEPAAGGDVEADGETGEVAGAGTATQEDDFVALEPEVLEQLLRGGQREATGIEVALEVRQHVLIEAAEGEAAGVGLDLEQDEEKPDGLQSFTETAGGVFGEMRADGCDFSELGAASGIRLGFGLLAGERGEALHEDGGSIKGNQGCLVEDFALRILLAGGEDLGA